MSYTYASFKTALANLLEFDEIDPIFTAMLPDAITYAEERIYLDAVPIAQNQKDSAAATPNVRDFTLPTAVGNFRALTGVNIITPAGTPAASGKRNPVTPASRDVIDMMWPEDTEHTGVPLYYCQRDNNTITFGPSPDAAYVVEAIGFIRPAALSASNTTTYISSFLPALFLAAAAVFGFGFQRNYGAQSDDPKSAVSWEAQYQALLASTIAEEKRKRSDS